MELYKVLLPLREVPWGKQSVGYLGKSGAGALPVSKGRAEDVTRLGGGSRGEHCPSQEKPSRAECQKDYDLERNEGTSFWDD